MAISILSIAILAASSALACKGVIPNEFQRAQNACLEKCHVADVACQTTCAQVQVCVTYKQTQQYWNSIAAPGSRTKPSP